MLSELYLTYFDTEEQKSEVVRIDANVINSMEISVLTDIQAFLDTHLDLTRLNEQELRSHLAYFHVQAPYYRSASGVVRVVIDETQNQVLLEIGRKMFTSSGIIFTQTNSVALDLNQSAYLSVTQGEEITVTGVYDTYISVVAEGVNLDTISLYLNGVEIYPIEKNATTMVVEPYNGFFAFYYNGTLFVKVFEGPDVTSSLIESSPNYRLSYYKSDGVNGNVAANSITSYVSALYDIRGNPVTYHFEHDAMTGGSNAPTRVELADLLAYWLYTKDCVSKTSDYVRWFRTQPEVGDAEVRGDYDDYIDGGANIDPATGTAVWRVSGEVRCALLDKNGVPVDLDIARTVLDYRLAKYCDVGIRNYFYPQATNFSALVRYSSVPDEVEFTNVTDGVIKNYFNLSWVRDQGGSLFEEQDTLPIIDAVKAATPTASGLDVFFYYYKKAAKPALTANLPSFGFDFYKGLVSVGQSKYRFEYYGTPAQPATEYTTYGIYPLQLPDKMVYQAGEPFDPSGLRIALLETNKVQTRDPPFELPMEGAGVADGYTLTVPDMSLPGTVTITVGYFSLGQTQNFTTSFDIAVIPQQATRYVTEIRVTSGAYTMAFPVGFSLSTGLPDWRTGLHATIVYSDGYHIDYDGSSTGSGLWPDKTNGLRGFNSSAPVVNQPVYLAVNDGIAGTEVRSRTFYVNIYDPLIGPTEPTGNVWDSMTYMAPVVLKILSYPTLMRYYATTNFIDVDLAGLSVIAILPNNATRDVYFSRNNFSGFDSNREGETLVTLTITDSLSGAVLAVTIPFAIDTPAVPPAPVLNKYTLHEQYDDTGICNIIAPVFSSNETGLVSISASHVVGTHNYNTGAIQFHSIVDEPGVAYLLNEGDIIVECEGVKTGILTPGAAYHYRSIAEINYEIVG